MFGVLVFYALEKKATFSSPFSLRNRFGARDHVGTMEYVRIINHADYCMLDVHVVHVVGPEKNTLCGCTTSLPPRRRALSLTP